MLSLTAEERTEMVKNDYVRTSLKGSGYQQAEPSLPLNTPVTTKTAL